MMHQNILIFIDLKLNKKIALKTKEYSIKQTKDGAILKFRSPVKRKIHLYEGLIRLIKQGEPITIEVAKWSKFLLAVSQNNTNLVEILEKEWDKNTAANN
jgi:hypothetical protein